MSLSVGIVGLPNAGKSTLFNALCQKQQAATAIFPFTTIEPNEAVVPVPDSRLEQLAAVVKLPAVPAKIKFVDIAGLVKGAHQGEGLGNQFLAHIREVDLIVLMVRDFVNKRVARVGSDIQSDMNVVVTELKLKDIETVQSALAVANKNRETKRVQFLEKVLSLLNKDIWLYNHLSEYQMSSEEKDWVQSLFLLTNKPVLLVINQNEERLGKKFDCDKLKLDPDQIIRLSAKMEQELATTQLSIEEKQEYLREFGIERPIMERLIKQCYDRLGLITYFTATGGKEVRAWAIKQGRTVLSAAGQVHTDFAKKFVKAEVVRWDQFVRLGGWVEARQAGKTRIEGKDYLVKDGDLIEFRGG